MVLQKKKKTDTLTCSFYHAANSTWFTVDPLQNAMPFFIFHDMENYVAQSETDPLRIKEKKSPNTLRMLCWRI